MPSINISLPAISVLPAGMGPAMAAGVLPGDGFAAMMASIGDGPSLDSAALPDPAVGTPLPVGRQEIAGDPPPLPEIEVEEVMLGAVPGALPVALPPSAEAPAPAQTPAAVPLEETSADPAAPAAQPIACGLQTWDPRGPHGRGPARTEHVQLSSTAVQTPSNNVLEPMAAKPDADEPEQAAGGAGSDRPEQSPAEPRAQAPAPASPPPPVFAPVEWTRAAAAPEPDAAVAADPKSAPAPSGGTAPAVHAPAAGQAVPPAPVNQAAQTNPVAPPPAPAMAAPLPRSFELPPEIAREVAELVRAASRKGDESISLPAGGDAAPAPSVNAAPQAAVPLHRDFVAAHRPPIDTSRGEWLQTMIDRIAEMPQADGRREAQIRLLPDALGAIEVKIEQRQDRVHVTLNADNAQTRQLLADATPRLHELAEARGLRLGQTGIGGGEQQDRRPAHEQQQQQQATPLRPRSASADTGSENQSDGDLIA